MKFTFLLTSLLVALNLLIWKTGSIFLINPPQRTSKPNFEVQISRTPDDIARGLLFSKESLSQEQKNALQALFLKGYHLRKEWEFQSQQHTELQEQLLHQTKEALVWK